MRAGASAKGFGDYFYEGNTYEDRYAKDDYTVDGVKFTNGYLDYPIALMTADEVAFAGGKGGTNNTDVWYNVNSLSTGTILERSILGISSESWNWWSTMSVSHYANNKFCQLYKVESISGRLNVFEYTVAYGFRVRPTLSLKPNTRWLSGNGTAQMPYQIKIENE